VRVRTGDFFLDVLTFDAGEPRIEQTERTRNPLGPFQSSSGDALLR
jgi:hypothetical protein